MKSKTDKAFTTKELMPLLYDNARKQAEYDDGLISDDIGYDLTEFLNDETRIIKIFQDPNLDGLMAVVKPQIEIIFIELGRWDGNGDLFSKKTLLRTAKQINALAMYLSARKCKQGNCGDDYIRVNTGVTSDDKKIDNPANPHNYKQNLVLKDKVKDVTNITATADKELRKLGFDNKFHYHACLYMSRLHSLFITIDGFNESNEIYNLGNVLYAMNDVALSFSEINKCLGKSAAGKLSRELQLQIEKNIYLILKDNNYTRPSKRGNTIDYTLGNLKRDYKNRFGIDCPLANGTIENKIYNYFNQPNVN